MTMADRVGQQLGNYRLTRLLGTGGFAEVYLGEHIYLDTLAAIKVLHAQLSENEADHFRTEARTIARLVHPHIVRVLEFGIEGATPFLVVDYAPNGTLRKRYPRGVALALPLVVSYVNQIADALQYAHDNRVIHRDVKPENMLIGARHEILLSDFGIAVMAQSTHYNSTRSIQDLAGTISYMAPEQIQSQPMFNSDQYSLAIVVYEWLSGARPFNGSFTEVAVKHTLVPPPSLRERRPDLSHAIEEIVLKGLAKDPQQRFATIKDFAHALEQACQQEPGYDEVFRVIQEHPEQASSVGTVVLTRTLETPVPSGPDVEEAEESSTTAPLSEEALPAASEGSAGGEESPAEPSLARPRSVSRRAVIGGLAGVALLAAGGTAIFLAQHKNGMGMLNSTATASGQGTLLYTYRGHSDLLWTVAWSPNGKYIASAGTDRTVQVWNATDGSHIYTYTGHNDTVYGVAWSRDSTQLASASYDKTVQVWHALDGTYPQIYTGHTSWVWSVSWSPDGGRIASGGGDRTVQIWRAADASHVYTYKGHNGFVHAVAWSPDSRYIASASTDQTVQIWDAGSGMTYYTDQPYNTAPLAVAWSPDSSRIAAGHEDKTVQVWDALNGAHRYTYYGHSDFVYSTAWSPNGKYIASSGDDQTVQVWSSVDGSNAYKYTGHASSVRSVSWSPAGRLLASASWDKTAQVWQALPS
jgi:eukaryotic-like serine/threonine-protein kinase